MRSAPVIWAAGLVGLFAAIVVVFVLAVQFNLIGKPHGPGEISGTALRPAVITSRMKDHADTEALAAQEASKHILFGDFHVHTTYSTDAFLWALPMNAGQGAHPISEACDFARYCSALDFWSITDHAEALTPRKWRETKESVKQCQAISSVHEVPDLISFIGFEWTQAGQTPDTHYGHKNVIFRDLTDETMSTRPIASTGAALAVLRDNPPSFGANIVLAEATNSRPYFNFNAFAREIAETPLCPDEMDKANGRTDCMETAATPGELVASLEAQNTDALIIPHGSTWGFYTPPTTSWDKQLTADMRPDRMSIIEIYSGHGNSEEYRDWREALVSETGEVTCPAPHLGYYPSCWRAGDIVLERCIAEGIDADECAQRANEARNAYARYGVVGHFVIPGETSADWLGAGQCLDCFQPAFNYRPRASVQYGLAISNFDAGPDLPQRFKWGFIASSDNHRARPGTGYKEVERKRNTDANGPRDAKWYSRINPSDEKPTSEIKQLDRAALARDAGLHLMEVERQSSFFQTGGLAAVHAETRSREAIWDAFERREVYATSGPRMLLWFDLLNAEDRPNKAPMGSEVEQASAPVFKAKALGAFKQKPGCPDYNDGLAPDKLQSICGGECYHPSDVRHKITHIEVIRILPQTNADENPRDLIQDPYIVHTCQDQGAGCEFEFSDPAYASIGRDATYYVRAIQEQTPTINAENLRCTYDGEGNCIAVNPCYGDYRSDDEGNCTAPSAHRAWSSPIFLSFNQIGATDAVEAGTENNP